MLGLEFIEESGPKLFISNGTGHFGILSSATWFFLVKNDTLDTILDVLFNRTLHIRKPIIFLKVVKCFRIEIGSEMHERTHAARVWLDFVVPLIVVQ